MTVTSQCHNCK